MTRSTGFSTPRVSDPKRLWVRTDAVNNAPRLFRIVTITDHDMAREWLAATISREHDLTVSAEAGDAAAAVHLLTTEAPDLVLLEVAFDESAGLNLLRQIRGSFSHLSVLVFGDSSKALDAESVIRAGARGYLSRRDPKSAFITAIRRVLSGAVYLCEAHTNAILHGLGESASGPTGFDSGVLSQREREALVLLGSGYKPAAIASQMKVSIRTFESYSARIRQKLAIATTNELILCAVAWMRTRPR